jgi:hypothetical protein
MPGPSPRSGHTLRMRASRMRSRGQPRAAVKQVAGPRKAGVRAGAVQLQVPGLADEVARPAAASVIAGSVVGDARIMQPGPADGGVHAAGPRWHFVGESPGPRGGPQPRATPPPTTTRPPTPDTVCFLGEPTPRPPCPLHSRSLAAPAGGARSLLRYTCFAPGGDWRRLPPGLVCTLPPELARACIYACFAPGVSTLRP